MSWRRGSWGYLLESWSDISPFYCCNRRTLPTKTKQLVLERVCCWVVLFHVRDRIGFLQACTNIQTSRIVLFYFVVVVVFIKICLLDYCIICYIAPWADTQCFWPVALSVLFVVFVCFALFSKIATVMKDSVHLYEFCFGSICSRTIGTKNTSLSVVAL